MVTNEIIEICDSILEMTCFTNVKPKRETIPSACHLVWMLGEIKQNASVWKEGKIGRWLGFIQGVLCCKGYTTIDEERKRNTMYEEQGHKETAGS